MNYAMRCVIVKCRTEQNRRDPNISFHRFPEFKLKRDQWISALNLKAEDINHRSIVCSLHFRDEDFLTDYLAGRRRLRPTAVPFLAEDPLSFDEHSPPCYKSLGDDYIEDDPHDDYLMHDFIEEDPQDDDLQNLYDNVTEDFAEKSVTVSGNTTNLKPFPPDCYATTSDLKNQLKDTYATTCLSPTRTQDLEPLSPDCCATTSDLKKLKDTGATTCLSVQRTQKLEAKIDLLEKAVVERDRMIKVLNTKIRFKSERIANLLQIISKLKREKRKAHQTKLKRPSND